MSQGGSRVQKFLQEQTEDCKKQRFQNICAITTQSRKYNFLESIITIQL